MAVESDSTTARFAVFSHPPKGFAPHLAAFRVPKARSQISINKACAALTGLDSPTGLEILWDRVAHKVVFRACERSAGSHWLSMSPKTRSLWIPCRSFLIESKIKSRSYTPECMDTGSDRIWGFEYEVADGKDADR